MQTDKALNSLVEFFSAREVEGALASSPPRETVPRCSTLPTAGVSGQPLPTGQSRLPGSPPYYLDYTANLFDLDILPRYNLLACKPKYIVYQCDCGRHIVPSTCMNLNCLSCAPWTGSRRAESVFNRLRGKRVCYTVFTVPLEIRERFAKPKLWQKVRKIAWAVLRDKFGAKYGVEASHPIGDKTHLFHPHLNFLWVVDSGVSPYIDVTSLRTEWAQSLGVLRADVYHQYTTNELLIRHWAKYVTRVFPGFHYWTGPIRWYGRKPKAKPKQKYICADCGQEWKALGYIDARTVSEYYQTGYLIGLDPPWFDNSKIVRYKRKGGTYARRYEDIERCNV